MNNNEEIQVRKIPKKTIIIIVIMTVIIVLGFIFIQESKALKIEEILQDKLGHKNISKVKVINKLSVEDKQTKIKSTVYKVIFQDNNKNKECVGFIHRSNNGKKYTEDFDCK